MRLARLNPGGTPAGSVRPISKALDDGKAIRLDTLTGSVCTLPPALGTGARYRFIVTVPATTNSHIIQRGVASDIMVGVIMGTRVDTGNAVLGFAANGTNHNTITLNRTTTGSVSKGEWVQCEDIAPGVWFVTGMLSATGAAFASPFSNT